MASTALHIAIVLSPFLVLPFVGWLGGGGKTRSVLAALVPAGLTGYFAYAWVLVNRSGAFSVSAQWAPALNLSLSFRFDGLSTLFAMLITAVGTLIVVYAAKYLEHHPQAGRFNVALFAFMGSMLGLVLSDNVIALFVFWELTGFTSYLLIGFDHERPEARRAATQALLVTGGGGLALLAAGLLMRAGWRHGAIVGTGRPRLARGRSDLRRHRCTAPAGGVHEVRPVPVSLLAAERHAGAHARERLSALGNDGESGRLSGRANDPDRRRDDALDRHASRLSALSRCSSARPARCSRPISSASSPTPRSVRSAS